MKIRKAKNSDLPQLIQLSQQLWPGLKKEELAESFLETFNSPKEITFISEYNNATIGFAICSLRSDYVEGADETPICYLKAIFIVPGFRQKGWARNLLAHSEKWCLEQGCRQIASDTELTNLVSQQFHQHIGFEEVNRIVCFVKNIK